MQNSKIKKKIITLIGQTACNKTSTAVHLIKKFPISIIGVDSVQIYKRFNIGSAKPTKEILKKYKHHLVDIADPENIFSVKDFYDQAFKIVTQAHSNNRIPLFVGGTMMYFKSLYEGIHDLPLRDDEYRSKLKKMYSNNDLYDLLKKVDPEYAKKLDANDELRILRALEINKNTGKPFSKILQEDTKESISKEYEVFQFGIVEERSLIHERIEKRLENIISMGLEDEAKKILQKYELKNDHPIRRSINYKQIFDYLESKDDFDTFKSKALFATRQLAKRQITWMRSWSAFSEIKMNEYIKLENEVKKAISLL